MTTEPKSFESWFQQRHPAIALSSAQAVLTLAGEGATVPFIARYRKERTGNLDEVAIQQVIDARYEWDQLIQRKGFVLGEIEKQGKLTPELKAQIEATFDPDVLEDIYLPYRQKRRSKAELAREAGLQPLADWIWNCGHGLEEPQPGQTLEIWAYTFKNEEKGFADAEAAIQGAQDILIERLSEMTELRQSVRTAVLETGHLRTSKAGKSKPHSKYEKYFDHSESVQSLLKPENSHRYLAIRRGWIEEELSISFGGSPDDSEFEDRLLKEFEAAACSKPDSPGASVLLRAAKLALKAHVFPSIENEAHKALREVADQVAIRVFMDNLRQLLLASPFGPKCVLGVDPGIRTGCKLALVDDSGKYLVNGVLHLQGDEAKTRSKQVLLDVIRQAEVKAIAVGNGTAGRETEVFVRSALKEAGLSIPVVMVSEAGASVYSASPVAREEFPDLDVTVRGAISIARRLQDPLAELVKVDPKSIGVGQYQHDVSQHALKRSLELVVDSCVNSVGVNLNTASAHLLARVSGIGETLAQSIVQRRGSVGLFKSRKELMEVPRLGQKAFEQAAGFLRIPDSENPLDNTGVHPERYELLEIRAQALGKSVKDFLGDGVAVLKKDETFKTEVGEFTFADIIADLEKPGRDPREEFTPFQFRDDIATLEDLKPGMICPGIVTNVANFGAFVDIGVHQDGLVHLSQLSDKFIKEAREVVSPGDRVQVKVLEVNLDKKQIALSMKAAKDRTEAPKKQPRQQAGGRPGPRHPSGKPSPIKKAPPKQAFNNPFAALAGLKKDLKSQ